MRQLASMPAPEAAHYAHRLLRPRPLHLLPARRRRVCPATQGIQPEVRTYNTIITACNKSGKPEQGLKVYERMVGAGVRPSATTYTALISAYGKQGLVEKAMDIFAGGHRLAGWAGCCCDLLACTLAGPVLRQARAPACVPAGSRLVSGSDVCARAASEPVPAAAAVPPPPPQIWCSVAASAT